VLVMAFFLLQDLHPRARTAEVETVQLHIRSVERRTLATLPPTANASRYVAAISQPSFDAR